MSEKKFRRELLIKLRTENGWTQQQVASKLEISTSRYGMYETGSRTPSPIMMKRISDLFNRPVTEIFFDAFNNETLYRKQKSKAV